MDMTSAAARLLLLAALIFTGCGRTREVARSAAVTTFRVIDAPANYVRRKIDAQEEAEAAPITTTTTTTTTGDVTVGSSDVVTPGRPVPPRTRVVTNTPANPGTTVPAPTPRVRRDTTTAAPQPQPTPAASDFPTARPVPGKPGFVYSIAPDGGIVDVTGYKSGDKAKDPYTKQIFIVP
jgi:hypothetical protein